MASMIGGHFVETYMLKKACKERISAMEAAAAEQSGGGSGKAKRAREGLLGLVIKKKVHPDGLEAPRRSSAN